MNRITLFENVFSPFARKVRMVLEYKGLEFDSVDGLHVTGREALARVNPRKEVPVLVDGDAVIVNSAHIVAYLEDAHPNPQVLPGDAAARDLDALYGAIEAQLARCGEEYLCGPFSLADIALFPNLYATRALKLGPDPARFPLLVPWLKRVASQPVATADLERLRAWLKVLPATEGFERDRIFWRGDRIEWLLANGFHRWFLDEIEQGRALFPGTTP